MTSIQVDVAGLDQAAVINLLRRNRFSVREDLGQHLLRSTHVANRLIDVAAEGNPAQVLDVGAGSGLLSFEIARRGYPLWAIEKDHRLSDVLTSRLLPFGDSARVTIGDIFEVDLAANLDDQCIVVAILPFDHELASKILTHLFEATPQISTAVVVTPSTVARYCATVGSSRGEFVVEIMENVPETAFWPRSSVELELVRISRPWPDEPGRPVARP